MRGTVVAVSRSASHSFSKRNELAIAMRAGLGVEGDAHQGRRVQHRYLARRNPFAANLRQVHLLPSELLDELGTRFSFGPGELGENVTTRGIDLAALPLGTRLCFGSSAIIELTGLRTPCKLIENFRPGLLAELAGRNAEGQARLRAGVMAIVLADGDVAARDDIRVEVPASGTLRPLPRL